MEALKIIMASNLWVGLISGLLVTCIVLVANKIWLRVVVPWFEDRVYKDLHIEGKWYSLYVSSSHFRQEVINLHRSGHKISGSMTCKTGPDDGEEYCLNGSFRNMLLPLTYEATDKAKTDRGTITLRSVYNGERMEGSVAMYNTGRDAISTSFVVWFRKKSELKTQIEYLKSHRAEMQDIRDKAEKSSEELKEMFKKYWDQFREEKEKEKTIEGSAERIEDKS